MATVDAGGRCGLGCVNLGATGRPGIRLIHQAMDLGVRFFDTADAYGGGASERVIGHALRHRRGRAVVATKAGYVFRERTALERMARRMARPLVQRAGHAPGTSGPAARLAGRSGYGAQDFSPAYLRTALEASLRRLDTDYVDLYQLHGPHGVCAEDVVALMNDLRSEGKIRGFGVGLESLDDAMDWLGLGAVASIQIPFGVLDPAAADEIIPRARELGVSVVARGVFAGGLLVDRSDGADALLRAGQPKVRAAVRDLASAGGVDVLQIGAWFVARNPGVTTVLVGTSSPQHLEQNLSYVNAPVPDDVGPLLDALAATDGARGATDPIRGEGGAE